MTTAQIAKRLLSVFGSIGSVMPASRHAFAKTVEDQAIITRHFATKPSVLAGLGDRFRQISFDLRDIALQQWIVGLFRGYRRERIHVLLLDRDNRLILDEPLNAGGVDKVEGNLRQIVSWGIGIGASGVVLMHNHPSGDVNPSTVDVQETRRIAYILGSLDLQLVDHLIVAESKIFSMKGAMLI